MDKQEMLDKYVELGWHLLPIQAGTKIPQAGLGLKHASNDPVTIKAWNERWPDCSWAAACAKSGFVAIDVDPRNGGTDGMRELLSKVKLPVCPVQATGGGGIHYIVSLPSDPVKATLAQGVDLKANGYILVAPSNHESGGYYEWRVAPWLTPPPPMGEDLLELAKKPDHMVRKPTDSKEAKETTNYGAAALEREGMKVLSTGGGGRNNQLNSSAFVIGQLVSGGEITEQEAMRELYDVGIAAGLTEIETRKTIFSGLTSGKLIPRSAPMSEETQGIREKTDSDNADPVLPSKIPPVSVTFPMAVDVFRKRAEGGYLPVPTLLPGLDSLLGGGYPRGQTSIITAPPGYGKSSYALQLCVSWARLGHPALFWSLELGYEDAHARVISMERALPWAEIRTGAHLGDSEAVSEAYSGLPLYILDEDQLPKRGVIEPAIEELSELHGEAPLILVDYAQLLSDPATADASRITAEKTAKDLLDIAKKHDVPMVLLCSVARSSYQKKGGSPEDYRGMAKESGRWESDAAAELAIVPTVDHNPRDRRGVFMLSKNRLGGPTGRVGLAFDGLRGTWREITLDEAEVELLGKSSDKVRCEMLHAIKESGGFPKRGDLYQAVKGTNKDKSDALNKLIEDGVVKGTPAGAITLVQ